MAEGAASPLVLQWARRGVLRGARVLPKARAQNLRAGSRPGLRAPAGLKPVVAALGGGHASSQGVRAEPYDSDVVGPTMVSTRGHAAIVWGAACSVWQAAAAVAVQARMDCSNAQCASSVAIMEGVACKSDAPTSPSAAVADAARQPHCHQQPSGRPHQAELPRSLATLSSVPSSSGRCTVSLAPHLA